MFSRPPVLFFPFPPSSFTGLFPVASYLSRNVMPKTGHDWGHVSAVQRGKNCFTCPTRQFCTCLFCTATFEAFHLNILLMHICFLTQTTFCTTYGKQIIFPSCINEDPYWTVYYPCLYQKRHKEIQSVGSPLHICQNNFDLFSDSVKGLQLPQ